MYNSRYSDNDDKSGRLVLRLRERDPQALTDLYDIYGRIMYVVIVRIVQNPSVAEDLVQESFLRAWNRADQLSDVHESVGPWLLTIARRCALDYRKSSAAHLSSHLPIEDNQFPSITMDTDLFSSERERLIAAAFESLSENQKRVIRLSFYEDLSHSAIAARLNQPLGTVKGWARSALSRLRYELESHTFDLVARN